MLKKISKIVIFISFLIFCSASVFADGNQPPPSSSKSGNFSKSTFSNKNAWSNNGKSVGPPDPSAAVYSNNPVPISNGLAFLLVGSVLFLIKRVRDDKQYYVEKSSDSKKD